MAEVLLPVLLGTTLLLRGHSSQCDPTSQLTHKQGLERQSMAELDVT